MQTIHKLRIKLANGMGSKFFLAFSRRFPHKVVTSDDERECLLPGKAFSKRGGLLEGIRRRT